MDVVVTLTESNLQSFHCKSQSCLDLIFSLTHVPGFLQLVKISKPRTNFPQNLQALGACYEHAHQGWIKNFNWWVPHHKRPSQLDCLVWILQGLKGWWVSVPGCTQAGLPCDHISQVQPNWSSPRGDLPSVGDVKFNYYWFLYIILSSCVSISKRPSENLTLQQLNGLKFCYYNLFNSVLLLWYAWNDFQFSFVVLLQHL